jgi:hypothetical protein
LLDVVVGLELRIALDQAQKSARRLAERRLGGTGLGRSRRGDGGVARLHHLGERLLLVAHGVLHDLHQVGNEIVAALELDVDLAPRRLRLVAAADQAVVDGDRPQRDQDDDA